MEQGKFEKAPLEDILQMTFPVDPKLKDRVREQVAATVSQLPAVGERHRARLHQLLLQARAQHDGRRHAALRPVPADDPADPG